MYRIDDKPEAIRQVQTYLRVVGNPEIFIYPSGIYDENTRLSVIDFQTSRDITPSGDVDKTTFDLLFSEYVTANDKNELNRTLDSFISFPLLPGDSSDGMTHINKTLSRVLEHYGHTHSLRGGNFYSDETAEAVKIMRGIYMLEELEMIDEVFYLRLIADHDSIGRFNNNFR